MTTMHAGRVYDANIKNPGKIQEFFYYKETIYITTKQPIRCSRCIEGLRQHQNLRQYYSTILRAYIHGVYFVIYLCICLVSVLFRGATCVI